MKSGSCSFRINLYVIICVLATSLTTLSAQENLPSEAIVLDSIQFKNITNDKTHTIFAGQRIKIKMTDGRKLKGQFVRQVGKRIVIYQQDFELAVDLSLVKSIKAKTRGLIAAGGVALLTTGIAAIFTSGLAAIVAVAITAFTGEGGSIFLVAVALLVGGVGSTILGNSLLKQKTDLHGDWRLSS